MPDQENMVTLDSLFLDILHHLGARKTLWGILNAPYGPEKALHNRFEMIKMKVRAVDARIKKIREAAEKQGNTEILALLNEDFDFEIEATESKKTD